MKRSDKERASSSRVGVRELRQNLSVYLARVKEGDRLEVTEHGQPVALLVPLPPANDALARLVAAGLARPATRDLQRTLRDYPPRKPRPGERSLTEILLEMRDEERF